MYTNFVGRFVHERRPPKMTRQDNKLTALKVKALEKPGRYGDGLGLWLQVSENRGKSWVFGTCCTALRLTISE